MLLQSSDSSKDLQSRDNKQLCNNNKLIITKFCHAKIALLLDRCSGGLICQAEILHFLSGLLEFVKKCLNFSGRAIEKASVKVLYFFLKVSESSRECHSESERDIQNVRM